MKYLTSRREDFEQFNVGDEMIRYSLWKRNEWPLKEVKERDILNFFCAESREIKLVTEVVGIFKGKYNSKEELENLLEINEAEYDEEYITESKENYGNLFLYKVKVVDKVSNPLDIKLSRLGWERLD